MPNLHAVIGANFGDEGKGLMTDYLADGPKSLVIRYNGGAQAGHTVVTPDGKRHVFHHIGSGAFRGAPTFLSEHFLVNPLVFADEMKELAALGVTPVVYVDPRARVSTPWDMMLNQAVERSRGESRHGSCGLGIHETVVRSAKPEMILTVSDLVSGKYADKLQRIRTQYVHSRAYELGLNLDKDIPLHNNYGIERHFMEDIHFFQKSVLPMMWAPALARQFNDLVFEGAQGLRLDEESSYFPHVTCSKTGLHNVSKMVEQADLMGETMYAAYMTRAYVTRHGAGPLPHQHSGRPYNIVDSTNIPNPWQETLRFAYHDIQEFAAFVLGDWKGGSNGMRVDPYLTITCADQVGGEVHWYDKGELKSGSVHELATNLSYKAGLANEVWVSKGPTRADIEPL